MSETAGRSLSARGLVICWLAVFAGLVLVGRGLPELAGWKCVPYDRVAESSESLIQHALVPEICLAIAVCAVVTWLGWWRPVLIERRRVSRWYLLIPGLLIPLTLLSVDWDRLSAKGAAYTVTLLVTVLLVGFNEELFARGVLLVGVRRLASERAAWLWTSLAFGALHSGNVLVGESPGTVVLQVLLATLISTLFYLARRASGTIAAAMIMHALWDLNGLSQQPGGGDATAATVVTGLVTLALVIGSLVTARRWLRASPAT